MTFGSKYVYALYSPGDGSGGETTAAPAPAVEAPVQQQSNIPENPPSPEPLVDETADWVLKAFDPMNSDQDLDYQENIDELPSQEGIPQEDAPPAVSPGKVPVLPATQATPVATGQAPTSPGQPAGSVAAQPAALAPQTPSQAAEPSQILSQIAQGIAEQKAAFIDKLANEQYALSEKQLDDLGLTPEQGKFFARQQAAAHVNIVASMTQMQAQQLPVFVHGLLKAQAENTAREQEFFGQWPQLREVDKSQLAQVFQTVNTLNPNLRGAEWRAKAGQMACLQFGLPSQASSNGTAQPVVNQQVVRTPGPVVRPNGSLPHLPAGTSTAPASAQPTRPMNEWEKLAQYIRMDDEGAFDT